MMKSILVLLPLLVGQDSGEQPKIPVVPLLGAPASAPAVEEESGQTAAEETIDAPAVDVDLDEVLSDSSVHLPAITGLEADVRALYQTLDGLVSEGEEGAAGILKAAEGFDTRLEVIGVNEGRARQIEVMSNEVRALRVRLRLIELRAPSINSPNDGFKDIGDLSSAEVDQIESLTQQEATTAEADCGEVASGQDPTRGSLYPEREALLAFKNGDLDGVLRALTVFELRDLQPDSLYVYGCALIDKREFGSARDVFRRIETVEERETLRASAVRQLERMDLIENGIVRFHSALEEAHGR